MNENLHRQLENTKKGRHFVTKGTLLRYSLSSTDKIASSVANQRTQFVIEALDLY